MEKPSGNSSPAYKSIRVAANEAQPKFGQTKTAYLTQDAIQPKLRIVLDPSKMPISTRLSENSPVRDFNQASHGYKEFRKVDSRNQAKGTPSDVPKFIGSSYTHTVNAPTKPILPQPTNVTIPKPYSVLPANAQPNAGQYLHNRTINGNMIGSPAKRYVPEQNVPYLPPDRPVGPDNPVKALNAMWSACWDGEAGAIYYYNQESGEATWIPPAL
jgi:hypothetical protein